VQCAQRIDIVALVYPRIRFRVLQSIENRRRVVRGSARHWPDPVLPVSRSDKRGEVEVEFDVNRGRVRPLLECRILLHTSP